MEKISLCYSIRDETKSHSDSTNVLTKPDIINILEVCYVWWTCFASASSIEFHLCSSPDRRIPLTTRGWIASGVDFWFDPWSCQPKYYIIGMCCFSSKHASLRRKTKYCLGRNQGNESKWVGMSICVISVRPDVVFMTLCVRPCN